MSETTTPAPSYSEFLLRRLHSLAGVVPLAVFIGFHFFANSFATRGAEGFNKIVDQLRGMPFVQAIEWGGLFAPFLFHMFYGMWIVFSGKPNLNTQTYARNWAYFLQRATALVVFVFLLYHVISMKWFVIPEAKYPHGSDYYAVLRGHFGNPLVYWWYVFAVACTVYHLGNGMCTFFMTWGITVGKTSQKWAAIAMVGLAVVLFAIAVAALNGFVKGEAPAGKAAVAISAPAPAR